MDVYIEKDKRNAPFLLASSFCGLIKFIGSYSDKGVLHWQFTPKHKAQELLLQLQTKTEPHIPARDLFEAIQTFWQEVARERNEGIKYGKHI